MVRWTEIDDFATSLDVMSESISKEHIGQLYIVDGENFKELVKRIQDEGIEWK